MLAKGIIFALFLLMSTEYTNAGIGTISARKKVEYDNMYDSINAVGIYEVSSVIECSMTCSMENQCLTYFYNNMSKTCILHADPFTYTVMTKYGMGWSFYRSQDATGRCKNDYLYYMQLDLCYKFGPLIQSTAYTIERACDETTGLELIRITSEERQRYIMMITADIGLVYPNAICIQGTNMVDPSQKWTFNDGSLMTYFNWKSGQPVSPTTPTSYLRVSRNSNYTWSMPPTKGDWFFCTFMCEQRR